MPASRAAKWKTLAQLSAIFLYILPLSDAWSVMKAVVLVVAVVMTVVTGVDYVLSAVRWTRAQSASGSTQNGTSPHPNGGRAG
jgi:CDP-diacylglycerol--glycerol-3-phosphate 3-phosphatidyltransferase